MHLKGCTIKCQQWLNLKRVIRELSFPLESVNILQILYQLKCMNAATAAKSLQSCLTLCDPMDSSPPGSSVHGILQARILEWVVMFSSKGSSCPEIKPTSLMSSALAGRFFNEESLQFFQCNPFQNVNGIFH